MRLKFFLTFFALVSLFSLSQAQTLEFSQIANIDRTYLIPNAAASPHDSVVVTIPVGKVWKLTNARMSYTYYSSGELYPGTGSGEIIMLDGLWIYQGYSSGGFQMEWPLWLGPGTYTFKTKSSQYGTTYKIHWFVSILEFNVVP